MEHRAGSPRPRTGAGLMQHRSSDLPNPDLREGHIVAWNTYLPRLAVRVAAGGRVLRRGGAPAARPGVAWAPVRGGAARAGIRSARLRHRALHRPRLGA